jgi:hypothetical protein
MKLVDRTAVYLALALGESPETGLNWSDWEVGALVAINVRKEK